MANYSAASVANGFLEWGYRDAIRVDPMKIQKLCYFANGYYLALHPDRVALIEENFEAWPFGPVIPSLYHRVKGYRYNPITEYLHVFDTEQQSFIPAPAPEDDPLYMKVRESVWQFYGRAAARALSDLTHRQEGAWARTIRETHGARSAVIPREYIRAEFEPFVT